MRPTADPIGQLIGAIAVPAATAMVFHTLFNAVDTWWAGRWSTTALAALALSFPVFFVVIAASAGVGQGTTALIAQALGAGDRVRARRLFAQALLLSLAIGVLVALGGWFGAAPLFELLGATGPAHDEALAYVIPLLLATSVFVLLAVGNALLAAQGDTRSYRNAIIVGCVLIVGLDPLLMYGWLGLPSLGVTGIAVATVLLQILQLLYILHRGRLTDLGRGWRLVDLRPHGPTLRALLRMGVPASLTMLATGIGIFILTFFIARYGAEAVAAYGIAMRIEQLVLLPMIGLNAAAVTIVGQNFGAKLYLRVRAAALRVLLYGVLIMTAGAVAVAFARAPLITLFTADPTVLEVGVRYLDVAVLIFDAYTLVILGSGILHGLKRPIFGLAVGILRQILAPLLVVPFLERTMGWGLEGIFWTIFVVSWLAAGAILLYLCWRLGGLATEHPRHRATRPASAP
ncbi:MAG TPA: MATE family efflux transporter [Geminicoccaceae bacterium]|nr:MATE family efflux transporter [Geminicoccaceae bacterium]